MQKVARYLEDDIPEPFRDEPVLYLARHIATPNFETLRFLHLVEPLNMKTVISQDPRDKFVSNNQLKKALGKLPVLTHARIKDGVYHEQFERVSIVDFNTMNGKPFYEVQTLWGESLTDFHKSLFEKFARYPVHIVNDSEWIDRQHRGNLLAHYKKFLALFVVHGVLFEDYALDDREEARFIRTVLRPAYAAVERHFGLRPLIAPLTPTSMESPEFWISYPKAVLDIVQTQRSGGYTGAT